MRVKAAPTAVIQPVKLAYITGTELHALTNHVSELWNLSDDGRFGVLIKGSLTVVHNRGVVIRKA